MSAMADAAGSLPDRFTMRVHMRPPVTFMYSPWDAHSIRGADNWSTLCGPERCRGSLSKYTNALPKTARSASAAARCPMNPILGACSPKAITCQIRGRVWGMPPVLLAASCSAGPDPDGRIRFGPKVQKKFVARATSPASASVMQ